MNQDESNSQFAIKLSHPQGVGLLPALRHKNFFAPLAGEVINKNESKPDYNNCQHCWMKKQAKVKPTDMEGIEIGLTQNYTL